MKLNFIIKTIGVILLVFILLLAVVIIFHERILLVVTSKRVDFEYLKETGGIAFGTPQLKDHEYYIPVKCCAAGLYFITNKPERMTSAPLFYYRAVVKRKGKRIYFYLKERLDNVYFLQVKELKLGKLRQGRYQVYYLNRDNSEVFLKEVRVE